MDDLSTATTNGIARQQGSSRGRLPTVFIDRARCPACDSTQLKTLRSAAGGDGSVTRRTICLNCETRFDLVVE